MYGMPNNGKYAEYQSDTDQVDSQKVISENTGGSTTPAAARALRTVGSVDRVSANPYVFGNAGVLDAMRADVELWHMWAFGDSRLNGLITPKFAKHGAGVAPIGGVELTDSSNSVPGFSGGQLSYSAGDALPASPIIGGVVDVLTRFEAKTVAGTTSTNNTTSSRLSYSAYSGWSLADFASRLNGKQAAVKCVVRQHAGAWSSTTTRPANTSPTMPRIALQVRQAGTSADNEAGYYISGSAPIYTTNRIGYSACVVQIPSTHNWVTYKEPDIGVVAEQGVAIGQVDRSVAFSTPWIETKSGIVMHEVGCVPGRSVRALINDEITSLETFEAMRSAGGRQALFVAIGSNNPESHTAAQFKDRLHMLASRWRSVNPGAPIVLTSNYPAQADGNGEPYYVGALRAFAQEDECAVLIDTFAALPRHTEALASGFYTSGDGVHYTPAGQTAYAMKFWEIVMAA